MCYSGINCAIVVIQHEERYKNVMHRKAINFFCKCKVAHSFAENLENLERYKENTHLP